MPVIVRVFALAHNFPLFMRLSGIRKNNFLIYVIFRSLYYTLCEIENETSPLCRDSWDGRLDSNALGIEKETMSASGKAKKKFMDPVIHFQRKRIEVGQDETAAKMTVAELVKTGFCLANFPDFAKYAKKGFEKSPLQAGSNTKFSADGHSLLACVTGYPVIETMQQKDDEVSTQIISVEPLVLMSPDKMQATLCLHPPIPGASPLIEQDLSQLLEDAGIIYGIDPDALERARTCIRETRNEFTRIVIAIGKPPGKSTDASIRFEIEIGPLAGRFLDDGTIDFRERRIMVGVHEGQHIATKIPVVPGTSGINVLGELIEPAMGNDIKVRAVNDAAYSEDDYKVTATKDGVLSVVNTIIRVCSRQIVSGDIDYKTGNVGSNNCLTIRGSIQPGFKVQADGDIEIGGSVMSATVSSQANVVVKGGITGKNSRIEALGDVDIRFVEQGVIESGGITVVRIQSYYSRITALSDIRCQKGSKVMGGDLIAGGDLTVADVGSENCESTLLAAGVDVKRLLYHKELQDSIVQQQDEIIRWLQLYGGSAKSKKIRKMEEEVADTKLKLLQLNLIPGTGLYSRGGGDDSNDAEEENGNIDKVRIDVYGTVFAGTKIRIGNRSMVLDKTVSNRRFRLQKNLKSIIAATLR
jgi:uncharacterized protein